MSATATEIAAAVATGARSATDVLDDALAAIDAGRELHAFNHVMEGSARTPGGRDRPSGGRR